MNIKAKERLETFSKKIGELRGMFLGYPENQSLDYRYLYTLGLFEACIDNIGDSFAESTYRINSTEFENEVVAFFAKTYDLKEHWGYVTTCGTEANLCGIRIGRETYPDGVLYYSKDSHYSVAKASQLLRLDEVVVASLENGEIDYNDFDSKLDASRPVIINANIGTTLKGAIDNIDRIIEIVERKNIKKYYIHCDAALSGMLLPYLDNAPKISFKKNIGSVAVSGHKFIGMPFPCGVIVARKDYIADIGKHVEYLEIQDTTIMGSRCGLSAVFLWYAIQERGDEGFCKEANKCIASARYLYQKLIDMKYPCWLNEFSNTVYFKKPSQQLIYRWQLAKLGDVAHVVAMQHVTTEKLDLFCEELKMDSFVQEKK